MKKLPLFCLVFFASFIAVADLSTQSQAKLSEAQKFKRCYSQMTRLYLASDDDRLKLLKEKKATAVELCENLITTAQLDKQLRITGAGKVRTENEAVIKTFNTFHVTWFKAYSFMRAGDEFFTSNVYDSTEMSIPFTLALFKPKTPYRETLVSDVPYESVRTKKKPSFFLDHFEKGEFFPVLDKDIWLTGGALETEFKPEYVQTGKLLGFQENKRTKKVHEELEGSKLELFPGKALDTGGILGSASYLILTSGLDREVVPDGAMLTHRGWSKSILNDLLCRQLPVLTEEDVVNEVKKDSRYDYQQNAKCMTCHSTIDPMALAVKDKIVLAVYPMDRPKTPNKSLLVGNVLRQPSDKLSDDYAKDGYLKMRTYDGRLIEKPASNIRELATSLADMDDYYICAAKRYFNFFTGVDVDLNVRSEKTSASNEFYNFVVAEGLKLKQHQNVRTLIKNILSSDFYSSPHYGAKNE